MTTEVTTGNADATNNERSIYVAAPSSEMDRAKKWMAKLREVGFNVVSDWPEVIAATAGGANPTNATVEQRLGWASRDLQQVASARAFWLLLPEKPTIGAWVELGAAVMLSIVEQTFAPDEANRYLLCSGPIPERTIFTAFTDHYETDEAAFEFLARAKDA